MLIHYYSPEKQTDKKKKKNGAHYLNACAHFQTLPGFLLNSAANATNLFREIYTNLYFFQSIATLYIKQGSIN